MEAALESARWHAAGDAGVLARLDLALALSGLGDVHVALMPQAPTDAEALGHLRTARGLFAEAREGARALEREGALAGPDARFPGALDRKIAVCDDALARLEGKR
jgi:hypothetical protein